MQPPVVPCLENSRLSLKAARALRLLPTDSWLLWRGKEGADGLEHRID